MLLVTGMTGHSGNFFLDLLIENNYTDKIKCVVRENSDTRKIDNSGLNIEKVVGDLKDEAFLNKITINVDTILHIVSIRHTNRLLDAAIKNNVKKIVAVHTTGIFSKFRIASNEYEIFETNIRDKIKDTDIELIILRPTMIFGDLCDKNISKFIKIVDKFRIIPVVNGGKGLIQPVNARDLSYAYYNILFSHENELRNEYILSGERPLEMIEMFKLISKYLDKKTIFISIPLNLAVFMAYIVKLITFGKMDYVEKVQRMSENRSFSHIQAIEDFNYCPELFNVGLKREVDEYLEMRRWHNE